MWQWGRVCVRVGKERENEKGGWGEMFASLLYPHSLSLSHTHTHTITHKFILSQMYLKSSSFFVTTACAHTKITLNPQVRVSVRSLSSSGFLTLSLPPSRTFPPLLSLSRPPVLSLSVSPSLSLSPSRCLSVFLVLFPRFHSLTRSFALARSLSLSLAPYRALFLSSDSPPLSLALARLLALSTLCLTWAMLAAMNTPDDSEHFTLHLFGSSVGSINQKA